MAEDDFAGRDDPGTRSGGRNPLFIIIEVPQYSANLLLKIGQRRHHLPKKPVLGCRFIR
jgi:hypothetical protein